MEMIIHIGVGSDVVCSTKIGDARASMRGTDNETVHAFFLCRIIIKDAGHQPHYEAKDTLFQQFRSPHFTQGGDPLL